MGVRLSDQKTPAGRTISFFAGLNRKSLHIPEENMRKMILLAVTGFIWRTVKSRIMRSGAPVRRRGRF